MVTYLLSPISSGEAGRRGFVAAGGVAGGRMVVMFRRASNDVRDRRDLFQDCRREPLVATALLEPDLGWHMTNVNL